MKQEWSSRFLTTKALLTFFLNRMETSFSFRPIIYFSRKIFRHPSNIFFLNSAFSTEFHSFSDEKRSNYFLRREEKREKISILRYNHNQNTVDELSYSTSNTLTPSMKLEKMRSWLMSVNIDAFIIPSDDPHLSEYVAECFNRREFISGFSGSAGTVLITKTDALLWTDGRYFLQAEKELSKEWNLMKSGISGVPTISEWLTQNLSKNAQVGIDPFLHSYNFVNELKKKLENIDSNIYTIDLSSFNPVDTIWGDAQPSAPNGSVRIHDLKFAGESVKSKLNKVRAELQKEKADFLVVCALDEIAYLYNIRGCDIKHNPVAISYAIIGKDSAELLVEREKISEDVLNYLSSCGIELSSYSNIIPRIKQIVCSEAKIWGDPSLVNYAILSCVPENQRVLNKSPISMAKAIKNEAELDGMYSAHIRDGASLSEFLCWLEKTVKGGEVVSEVKVDEVLKSYRSSREGFLDLSFETIAGSGSNGAIVHYRAEPSNCKNLDTSSMFLLDSGAQYVDGTTDVTRTMHFGIPSKEQIRAYTLVLKGNIAIDTAVFPENTPGCAIDAFARRALWAAGMEYSHGTGHGVGAALNVHEGPHSISYRYSNTTPLKPGMIVSNEPGFYLPEEYGIRIENLLEVRTAKFQHTPTEKSFNCFKSLTLVPIQKSLIDVTLMTEEELDWLDGYHKRVWESLNLLVNEETKNWLREATSPIPRK